jgi:hypothetical protein
MGTQMAEVHNANWCRHKYIVGLPAVLVVVWA